MSKVPILVVAFNRADHVSKAMKAIREYQPDKLYLECDGPRLDKKGEDEKVKATRKAMMDAVDWPCEVRTLFRDENMGCAHAVNDAITWFFTNEEYGVICEDDIVLSLDFFLLCEELLPRYADNDSIMEIIAQNTSHRKDIPNSYVFSNREHCWGWASWARAWKKMDMAMSAAPNLKLSILVNKLGFFEGIVTMRNLKIAYKNIDKLSSWATRWNLSILANNGLVIVPGVNLAINIGMDGGAHYETGDLNPYSNLVIEPFQWPLVFNDTLSIDNIQAKYDKKDFFRVRMIGLKKKIKRLFK